MGDNDQKGGSNKIDTSGHANAADGGSMTPGYRPPQMKTVQELSQMDKEDESLQRYKERLLGGGAQSITPPFPENPKNVVLSKLRIEFNCPENELHDIDLDLKTFSQPCEEGGALSSPAPPPVLIVKQAVPFRMCIRFYVQREIVSGMRFVFMTSRMGVPVSTDQGMVGSFAPRSDEQQWLSDWSEMPSGLLAQGQYTVKALFTDDDQNELMRLNWQWEIRKEWPTSV